VCERACVRGLRVCPRMNSGAARAAGASRAMRREAAHAAVEERGRTHRDNAGLATLHGAQARASMAVARWLQRASSVAGRNRCAAPSAERLSISRGSRRRVRSQSERATPNDEHIHGSSHRSALALFSLLAVRARRMRCLAAHGPRRFCGARCPRIHSGADPQTPNARTPAHSLSSWAAPADPRTRARSAITPCGRSCELLGSSCQAAATCRGTEVWTGGVGPTIAAACEFTGARTEAMACTTQFDCATRPVFAVDDLARRSAHGRRDRTAAVDSRAERALYRDRASDRLRDDRAARWNSDGLTRPERAGLGDWSGRGLAVPSGVPRAVSVCVDGVDLHVLRVPVAAMPAAVVPGWLLPRPSRLGRRAPMAVDPLVLPVVPLVVTIDPHLTRRAAADRHPVAHHCSGRWLCDDGLAGVQPSM
jgi:hypothetical protein